MRMTSTDCIFVVQRYFVKISMTIGSVVLSYEVANGQTDRQTPGKTESYWRMRISPWGFNHLGD